MEDKNLLSCVVNTMAADGMVIHQWLVDSPDKGPVIWKALCRDTIIYVSGVGRGISPDVCVSHSRWRRLDYFVQL